MAVRQVMGSGRHHRGQIVPILAVLLLLASIVAMGLVRVALAASHRGLAEAAAEAAALAGAAEGPDAAARVAEENEARMVHYKALDLDVVVTVVRRGVQARARARWVPDSVGTPAVPRPA